MAETGVAMALALARGGLTLRRGMLLLAAVALAFAAKAAPSPQARLDPVTIELGRRVNTLTPDDVLRLYPQARRWGEVRKRADPQAKFLNAHLRELFAFSL